jgi:hypothetical protein
MPRAYFDTTVPSWIVDGKVPADEVAALAAAFTRKALIAPAGPVILDELIGELEIDRAAMIQKLTVLRQFDTFHGMLKMPSDILKEAIEAYAAGAEPPPVSAPEGDRRRVVAVLVDVIAGSRKYDADLKEAVGSVEGLKNSWFSKMFEAQGQALTDPEWGPRIGEARQTMPFEDFFEGTAAALAERLADSIGCGDRCRGRGIDGLLKVPAVRLCVGVVKSQIYTQIVGTRGQPDVRRPHRGDGYDVWHAILASTADVFVTFDGRLADHVERIPDVGNPRVARSVEALLAAIS